LGTGVHTKKLEILAKEYRSFSAIADAYAESTRFVNGVDDTIADSIHDFFANPSNREIIRRLREAGVKVPAAEATRQKPMFDGLTFVFTGELESMTRREAEQIVKDRGGRAASSVSKKTGYVVAGPGAGAKLAKAQQLGVNVVDEATFRKMLNEGKR